MQAHGVSNFNISYCASQRMLVTRVCVCVCVCVLDIVDEELFAQFNKIANSILCSKSKEQNSAIESLSKEGQSDEKDSPTAKSSCCSKLATQSDNPIMIIKALQVCERFLSEFSSFKHHRISLYLLVLHDVVRCAILVALNKE